MRTALLALALTLSACGQGETPAPAKDQVEIPDAAKAAQRARRAKAKVKARAEAAAPAVPEPLSEKLQALMDPSALAETAPDEFKVSFETTEGTFVVLVHRAWSPNGADRFYNLVQSGYYDDTAFFRVLDGFVAQFGIHGEPRVAARWREARIDDDPAGESNTR